MPNLARRSFLLGGLALLAAPAIVRAGSLMPIRGELLTLDVWAQRNSLLTIDMITREAVRLWTNSNEFLRIIDREYDEQFRLAPRIGSQLLIRLPRDYHV